MSDKEFMLKSLREDLLHIGKRLASNKAAGRVNLAKMDQSSITRIENQIIELESSNA